VEFLAMDKKNPNQGKLGR